MPMPLLPADIAPNTTGLPGLSTLSHIVGALLAAGLIAAVAGIAISTIVWVLGNHSGNPSLAGRGKTGVLVAVAAALLIGGANILVDFFSGLGGTL